MDNITHRVSLYITYKSLSVRGFEKSIGASNGVLSNAIKKGSDISGKWLSIIIETYPEIDSLWLLTGEGEMLKPSTAPRPESSTRYIAAIEAENKELKAENKKLYKQIGALEGENDILKKGGFYRRVGEGRSAAI